MFCEGEDCESDGLGCGFPAAYANAPYSALRVLSPADFSCGMSSCNTSAGEGNDDWELLPVDQLYHSPQARHSRSPSFTRLVVCLFRQRRIKQSPEAVVDRSCGEPRYLLANDRGA